jgi:hypothetical protein
MAARGAGAAGRWDAADRGLMTTAADDPEGQAHMIPKGRDMPGRYKSLPAIAGNIKPNSYRSMSATELSSQG